MSTRGINLIWIIISNRALSNRMIKERFANEKIERVRNASKQFLPLLPFLIIISQLSTNQTITTRQNQQLVEYRVLNMTKRLKQKKIKKNLKGCINLLSVLGLNKWIWKWRFENDPLTHSLSLIWVKTI
jgi:hypothetical protein